LICHFSNGRPYPSPQATLQLRASFVKAKNERSLGRPLRVGKND